MVRRSPPGSCEDVQVYQQLGTASFPMTCDLDGSAERSANLKHHIWLDSGSVEPTQSKDRDANIHQAIWNVKIMDIGEGNNRWFGLSSILFTRSRLGHKSHHYIST